MNPNILQVEAIIDWEFSGFYLPKLEALLWLKAFDEPGFSDIDGGKVERLVRILETINIIYSHRIPHVCPPRLGDATPSSGAPAHPGRSLKR